jgi:hypothetical protein
MACRSPCTRIGEDIAAANATNKEKNAFEFESGGLN